MFISSLSDTAETEPLLVDGKTLTKMLSVSPRWVSAHRHSIIGAQRIGGGRGPWRYNADIIRRLLLSGKDIVAPPPKPVKIPKKFTR